MKLLTLHQVVALYFLGHQMTEQSMKFTYIRKPYTYAEYREGYENLLTLVEDLADFQFYKLDRRGIIWLLAIELGSNDKPPANSIELSASEVTLYQQQSIKAKALRAFW